MVVTIVAGRDPTEHIARMAMYRPHMCGWDAVLLCRHITIAGLRDIHERKESTASAETYIHDHTYSSVDTGF
jgi:hypothetical protein